MIFKQGDRVVIADNPYVDKTFKGISATVISMEQSFSLYNTYRIKPEKDIKDTSGNLIDYLVVVDSLLTLIENRKYKIV